MIKRSYTDDALMTLFINGNEEAFTILYDKYYKQVLYFARRYTPDVDAQDITADCFVQLWHKRSQFIHIKAVATFLFITARNRCFDLIRHNKVRSKHESELTGLMQQGENDDFFITEVRIELFRLLRNEIEKLPKKMKEILLLSFSEGLKPAEIASRLNISVKTVSNQKLNAINIIKAALDSHPLELMLLVYFQLT